MVNTTTTVTNKAYVVFGDSNLWFLKCLKKGYRHCSIVYNTGSSYIAIDPCASITIVDCGSKKDMINLLKTRDRASTVVEVDVPDHRYCTGVRLDICTCVGNIKSLLGIIDIKVQTPHQLFKRLLKMQQCKNTLDKLKLLC